MPSVRLLARLFSLYKYGRLYLHVKGLFIEDHSGYHIAAFARVTRDCLAGKLMEGLVMGEGQTTYATSKEWGTLWRGSLCSSPN